MKNIQSIIQMAIVIAILLFASNLVFSQSLLNRDQKKPTIRPSIGLQQDQLLTANEAFKPSLLKIEESSEIITLYWEINPEYYLYKNKIKITPLNKDLTLINTVFEQGIEHHDEFFGTQEIFDNPTQIALHFNDTIQKVGTLHLKVEAQGCAKSGFCFAPNDWELSLEINPELSAHDMVISSTHSIDSTVTDLKKAPVIAEHDRLTQYLVDNQYLAIPLFFLLGLLLSFTPCVLPMLPILSGILTNQGHLSVRKGFTISLVYVLSMAFVYTLLGLGAAFMGKGLAAYLQHPYVLIGFSIIFVLLALSMFDFYQLQVPAFIQTKLSSLSNQQQAKQNYIGISIMGMLSALIVGPCVTAPLIGIIGLVAQTKNYILGGTALFSMSMGMGIPLLILGASSGHLLPKAGQWMNQVKQLFGFMLLGLAAYFIGRTLDNYWEQMLYALVALSATLWLIVYIAENRTGRLFFSLLAIATLMFGINSIIDSKRTIEIPIFTEIKGIPGLNHALQNNTANSITMLEFNADWCVACKEMEKYVFSDQDVKKQLQSLYLLTSDVTKNDTQDKALQKHFGIYGPPAILFFDTKGNELGDYRIMGSVSKEAFLDHINYILDEPQ